MSGQKTTLSGRTALVTGAARRLGRATALALAEAGANVVVHYGASATEAESLVAEIARLGRKAWALQADLSDATKVPQLFIRACEAAGSVDVLVNSASIFPESRLVNFSAEDLSKNVDVNAMAPLELGRELAARVGRGDIVNFLDARIGDYDREHVAYHLSKRMLADLTRLMALEFAPGVRVNAVAPGLILPPAGEDDAYLKELASTNPLQRHGSAGDVTSAVLFLLGSPFITGQTIFIDGGRHLRGRVYD
jgi:NAD(P)-dependent dehydrogenase (short-subunit alcohol dehydrogenase family)